MFKAVLFDFDYTLGNSEQGIFLSVNHGLKELGYAPQDLPVIKKTIGLSLKDTYITLTGDTNEEKAKKFSALFIEKANEVMVKNTELYDGVLEVLHSLNNRSIKIGIVTTKLNLRIQQILTKFEIPHLVDVIIGAEDVQNPKPSPEGIEKALKILGLAKAEILYVGDSITDAKAAERAGVNFAGVLTGATDKDDLNNHKNLIIAKNITEIYNFFDRENLI